MRTRHILLRVLIAAAFLLLYLSGLRRALYEKDLRSLELADEVAVADHVRISISITSIDLAKGQLMARLRLQPFGNLTDDGSTPKRNLKLYANSSSGQQRIEFREREGMTRAEATFPIDGDINRYPFDHYETTILLFVETPPLQSTKTQATGGPQAEREPEVAAQELALDNDVRKNLPVALSIAVSASTPGVKYSGEVIRRKDSMATRVHLNLVRPYNVINTAIAVMCLMIGLAVSVVVLVINGVSSSQEIDTLPLSISISLLFGLPALRNIQPGVPSVGVLGDYFAFIWAELAVAASAVIMAWTWLLRRVKASKSIL